MIRSISRCHSILPLLAAALLMLCLAGCHPKSSANKLDGVYNPVNGGPMTLTIKDGKATMTIATESKTMDYKVEGNKLTLINPAEGNVVMTINDDGTLNNQLGILKKSPK